jgi:hypothetical protein
MYLSGTFEERLLLRLVAKYERLKKRLKFAPNTLGVTFAEVMEGVPLLEGLAEEDGALFKPAPLAFDAPATRACTLRRSVRRRRTPRAPKAPG